jgi:hypothetical protein
MSVATQHSLSTARILASHEEHLWEDFIKGHPDANLYHSLLWRDVIEKIFHHRPLYLITDGQKGLTGILPMFLVKMPLLGSKLISLPYDIGSGGPLAIDESSELELTHRAIELAKEYKVQYLQLRCRVPMTSVAKLGFKVDEPVLISDMELSCEKEVLASFSKDHRKAIRKAETRGVQVRMADSLEDFKRFYQVYLIVFRDFGTPPYGEDYFPVLHERLAATGAVRLLLAELDGKCIGGLLLFCFGKNLVSKFAACLPEFVDKRAYPLLYWRAIQLGIEGGYKWLSWGTSSRDQTGLIAFKEGWGSKTYPGVLYSLPVKGQVPSLQKYYNSEGVERRVWKTLPIGFTRVLGGWLNYWFC